MKHLRSCPIEGCRHCAKLRAPFDRVVAQIENFGDVRTSADRRRYRRLYAEMQWRAGYETRKQRRRRMRLDKARRRRGWDEHRIWNRTRPLLERETVPWCGVEKALLPGPCLHVDGCGGFKDPWRCQRNLPF